MNKAGELINYKRGTQKCLPMAKDDLQEVVNMTVKGIRNYAHNQPIYADNREGLSAFLDVAERYFSYVAEVNGEGCEDKRLIPGVEGLCTFAGISRQTLMKYEHRNEQWHEAIQYIKTCIAHAKIQLAEQGKLPAIVLFFDLGNNAGYISANRVTVEHGRYIDRNLSNKELLSSLPYNAVIEETETAEDNGLISEDENDIYN